eukprot:PITA_30326
MRKLDGKDPATWILQMEQFFDLNNVQNTQKVRIATLYLEPNQFVWFSEAKSRIHVGSVNANSVYTEVWDIIDTGYTFPSTTPTDPVEKKKYETNAKAVNTLLGCLSQSEFVKFMQYKSAKEIWDKIVLSYEGDEQVKRAKLQTLRIQYENLRMHNDESVSNYFLRVDEIVNCMQNLGEEIKEVVVVEKVLRSLSPRFESKVFAIEEK